MVFYRTWEKHYEGRKAVSEMHQVFYNLEDKLFGLGHLLSEQGFNAEPDRIASRANAIFLLADHTPLVEAYINATDWLKKGSGEILLGVRHFSGLSQRFEYLEKLADSFGLKPNEPFESQR